MPSLNYNIENKTKDKRIFEIWFARDNLTKISTTLDNNIGGIMNISITMLSNSMFCFFL